MVLDNRMLLRLHVEAVWGVHILPGAGSNLTLAPQSARPDWRLCAAEIAEGSIAFWRLDVGDVEREALLARLHIAWSLPWDDPLLRGVSREVALRLAGEPVMPRETTGRVVRALTAADHALIEQFEPGSAAYYLQPQRSPLIGVIVADRLVSVAHSSRRTACACELGIDTLAYARRRGYALAATIAWTSALTREGLVPIYSALAVNTASLNLAAAAGYREFARVVTLA